TSANTASSAPGDLLIRRWSSTVRWFRQHLVLDAAALAWSPRAGIRSGPAGVPTDPPEPVDPGRALRASAGRHVTAVRADRPACVSVAPVDQRWSSRFDKCGQFPE